MHPPVKSEFIGVLIRDPGSENLNLIRAALARRERLYLTSEGIRCDAILKAEAKRIRKHNKKHEHQPHQRRIP